MEIRLFRGVSATKSRLRRAVFVFQTGGPGPLTGRAGEHFQRDKKTSALLIRRATVPHGLAWPAAAFACEVVSGHSRHLTGLSSLYSGLVGLVSVWVGYGGSRELKRGYF